MIFMVKVGDKVTRTPKTIEQMVLVEGQSFGGVLRAKPVTGTVVYVHPQGRFHVVEFENLRGDKLRETFDGVD